VAPKIFSLFELNFLIKWYPFKGVYYKKLRIRNLREMDRFLSKPVTFDLDKYTPVENVIKLFTAVSYDFS
jgi:hypothetical protein